MNFDGGQALVKLRLEKVNLNASNKESNQLIE